MTLSFRGSETKLITFIQINGTISNVSQARGDNELKQKVWEILIFGIVAVEVSVALFRVLLKNCIGTN